MEDKVKTFQRSIFDWHRVHKRDYLPWRISQKQSVSPYEIFVSEIMLQQTQVPRVLEKYPQFLRAFPTVRHLALSSLASVLKTWQGMGYNRRAFYLKRAAEEIVSRFGGVIPSDPDKLQKLPGVGSYTAGAVACFAFNKPVVFLDTNIRKVFLHYFFPRRYRVDDREILAVAEKMLSRRDPRRWHYALMDYGATVLRKERKLNARAKYYHKQPPFFGSARFFRSQIVKHLLQYKKASEKELHTLLARDPGPFLVSLMKDRLVRASDSPRSEAGSIYQIGC